MNNLKPPWVLCNYSYSDGICLGFKRPSLLLIKPQTSVYIKITFRVFMLCLISVTSSEDSVKG